ncbi:MAG: hypothetical protein JWO31_2062, partial [Phycisphaerales bacterium]|nr:hypothetical protein [Phycisphaerales bacterium]
MRTAAQPNRATHANQALFAVLAAVVLLSAVRPAAAQQTPG